MSFTIEFDKLWGSTPFEAFRWTVAAVAFADEVGILVRDEMKRQAPKRSGRLAASIRYERKTGIGFVRVEYKAYTPYAGFVLSGTRPHVIEPVAARALRWVDRSGSTHFAKRVNHPGTHANEFNKRAMERTRPLVEVAYSRHIRSVFK